MYYFFDIEKIPDLSLTKYMSLDESGVDGVLNKHSSFLRQLNRKGILSKVFFHLLYTYNPDAAKGKKLNISLVAAGNEDALLHTKELIQNSALSPFYKIICNEKCTITSVTRNSLNEIQICLRNHIGYYAKYSLTRDVKCTGSYFDGKNRNDYFSDNRYQDISFSAKILNNQLLEVNSDCELLDTGLKKAEKSYKYRSTLSKREFFVQPSIMTAEDNDLRYYKVSEWEMNDNARLYNMLKLMEGLNQPVTYRVDLFSVDYAMRLREVLPIKELRNRTSMKANKNSSGISINRDENAEETLKQYNDIIESYENSPHFRINITAFANNSDVSELIVDAAGAEALESGSYSIKTVSQEDNHGTFHEFSNIERPIDTANPEVVNHLRFMPNLFLLEEIKPFFTLPALFDGEVVEISKETAPTYDDSGMKIAVDENGYDVIFPISLFKKHAFLAGVPGSGKTNSMLHLTSTLWKKHHIPFLIFEPAKQEYRALARTDGMDELLIFSPSSGTYFPLHINPFEFPMGMSLSEHIRKLMAVFEGAFSLAPPAPYMIDYSIESIYRDKGWYPDTINAGSLPYPTIQDLYDKLAVEVEKTDYDGEVKGNLKSVLQVRIGSLLRREMGDVFNVPKSSMAPEEWLTHPALIELEAMGSGPANFLTLLLSTLIRETLKVNPTADGKPLRHVMFFEEAHNLIGPVASEVTGEDADPKMAATAFVVKMLAEVRALREGIVIADQLPTVMAPEVIKNTGLKIGHRITAEDDRSLLGSTMSANGTQLEQMATFLPGEALITFEGLLRPFKAQMCQWENGMASYDSPNNNELKSVMQSYSGYRKILKRSSEIMCNKFASQNTILSEQEIELHSRCNILNNELTKIKKFNKDNNISHDMIFVRTDSDNPLFTKAQEALAAFNKKAQQFRCDTDDLMKKIEELMVVEKGYLIQNNMYCDNTGLCLQNTAILRAQLRDHTQTLYPAISSQYDKFTDEMKSWDLSKLFIRQKHKTY